jgi:Flp pilus assembly protein TadG
MPMLPMQTPLHLHRRRWRLALGSRGNAAIEFALLLPLLVLVMLASIEFTRAFYIHDIMTKAIRDGTRYLARVPDPTNATFQQCATNLALRGSADSCSASSTVPLLIPNLDGADTAPGSVSWAATATTVTAPNGTTVHGTYVTGVLTYPFTSPLLAVFGFRGTFTIGISHNERAIGGGG